MNEKCKDVVKERWEGRRKDLKNPEFDWLGFNYVEPGTWDDQLEGYYRWQFSWGGPSDELRAYVNLDKSIHRLEYWFLDWGDGASVTVNKDEHAWQKMAHLKTTGSGAAAQKYAGFSPFRVRSITLVAAWYT